MWRKQLQVHLLKPKLVSNSELNIPNSRNIKPFKCILNLVRFVFAICMKTFIDHSEILSLERTRQRKMGSYLPIRSWCCLYRKFQLHPCGSGQILTAVSVSNCCKFDLNKSENFCAWHFWSGNFATVISGSPAYIVLNRSHDNFLPPFAIGRHAACCTERNSVEELKFLVSYMHSQAVKPFSSNLEYTYTQSSWALADKFFQCVSANC